MKFPTLFSDYDIYLFKEGKDRSIYDKLGAHFMEFDSEKGVYFAVWAPNAKRVSVIGDFNGWDANTHELSPRWDESGIWEGFIPGVQKGALYKYDILSKLNGYRVKKCDPVAFMNETPPKTASIVWDLDYSWNDDKWLKHRAQRNSHNAPISIYEVHTGSWKRHDEEGNRPLNYRELAVELCKYIKETGFTHVEFLPVMEHPFYGSWGYQTTGYFSPTSRYGTPQDFMFLIDHLHQNGIGVILDWVPSHFPGDEHSLGFFDGSHLYEHEDPRMGFHPDWNSYIFNYGRNEVKEFLISSAAFWFDKYHVDAIRVDAVASMLYLDYSRNEGEWIANEFGGNENFDAINFIKELNQALYIENPDIQTIAEESTAWPMVSKPVDSGGLGFGYKWNMGWMHDTLEYFTKDPVHRKYHHNLITFSMIYAFHENFVLSLSHDEVVYGKGSMINKMPGDDRQKASNLRALYGYMFGHPGKKLLFMGDEFGQWDEWNHESGLSWEQLNNPVHKGILRWVSDLNKFYRNEPALYEIDYSYEGFEWRDVEDNESSTLSFIRKGSSDIDLVLVACNFTPVTRDSYRIPVPKQGYWSESLNSNAEIYGGNNIGNAGGVATLPDPENGEQHYLEICLPPLSVVFFKYEQ